MDSKIENITDLKEKERVLDQVYFGILQALVNDYENPVGSTTDIVTPDITSDELDTYLMGLVPKQDLPFEVKIPLTRSTDNASKASNEIFEYMGIEYIDSESLTKYVPKIYYIETGSSMAVITAVRLEDGSLKILVAPYDDEVKILKSLYDEIEDRSKTDLMLVDPKKLVGQKKRKRY